MLDSTLQKQNTAFLTAGSDPFGLLPGAWPLALDGRIAACDGFLPPDRRDPVMLAAPGTGPAGVVSELFPMLMPDAAAETVIQSTIGPCLSPKEYPLSRFCAMLAELVLFDRMEAHREAVRAQEQDGLPQQDGQAVQAAAQSLTDEVTAALDGLRACVTEGQKVSGAGRLRAAELYEVSAGACCLTNGVEAGQFILDVFTAGDFHVFLWDEDGLSLIPVDRSRPLSPAGDSVMACRRVRFERHRPFGVLLLSGGLGSFRDRGRAGRSRSLFDRMYLEQRLLRVVQDAVTCGELSARAVRMLGSQASGQDSVSGGLLLPPVGSGTDGSALDEFRAMCRDRAARLEELLWLLSDKTADTAPAADDCTDAERAFARDVFRRDPRLADRVTDRLTARIVTLLDDPDAPDADASGDIPAEGCEPRRRLTREDVLSVFRRYDRENDADRARIAKNQVVIRTVLSEHWMTLRPVLCVPDSPLAAPVADTAARTAAARADACALLAARVAEQQAVITQLAPLTDSLIQAENGIAQMNQSFAERQPLLGGFTLPPCVSEVARIRSALADRLDEARGRMNSLFTAYTFERDCLFRYDTEPADGPNTRLRTAYAAMLHGRLPAASWQWCLDAVRACPETRGYEDVFRALPVISADIAASEAAIAKRSVRRRCIRELSEQADRMFDCLRAAVFRDTAWGDDIGSLIGEDVRRDWLAAIRKHREEARLAVRRRQAFDDCLAAAGRFGDLCD